MEWKSIMMARDRDRDWVGRRIRIRGPVHIFFHLSLHYKTKQGSVVTHAAQDKDKDKTRQKDKDKKNHRQELRKRPIHRERQEETRDTRQDTKDEDKKKKNADKN